MSSSSKASLGGGGRKGNNDIPSGCRKIVESLKEIVNSPEAEIYAMLKECNMDPNEAVHRLLSQDPFHEVKSKKEKKKESQTRDIPDSRLRGANNAYNRGGRGASNRYAGRNGSSHFSSTGSGNFQGKSTDKKESGTQGYTSSWPSASGVANHHQTPHSDSVVTENKLPSAPSGDGVSSSQSASGHQTAWFGAPGKMSMADIVKMGRPQSKTTNSQQNVNMRSEINHEQEVNANHQVPVKDEWPSIEKPPAPSTSSVSVAPAESEICSGPADFQSDQHLSHRLGDIRLAENGPSENLGGEHDSVAGRNVQEDESGVSSEFNGNQYTYQTHSHRVEHHKDEDEVSSGSAELQQLTVDDQEASHEEDRPAVLIPNHLLIHTKECSQLSFGSFGSMTLSNNAEETPAVGQQVEHSDARNTEFYGDEQLGSRANGNMGHAPAAGSYDDSLESRPEVLKQENSETAQENQYAFAQSEPGYGKQQQLNTAYDDASQTNAQNQMQNLASLSNVMVSYMCIILSVHSFAEKQGYPHSVPNNLLAQNARELDFQYAIAQSMQSRNNNNASPLGGQSIPMPEALRGSGVPATQPSQQTLPGGNMATGPALPPQQLPMHPYSQPTMPLAHFANMLGYPLMPQNYPYMPSAFPQTFAGNSLYQQQLAALLPQYKTNLSPSNLPHSATALNVGSAGNFPLNQHSTPPGTTMGYEDVLSSQYKESSHLLALQQQQQQNENSAMWHHGHGSRTMSGVPANTYYNLQAQQQLQQAQQAAGGYRQAQQQQHYGSQGYPNYYQSQTEMSVDRQQQNPRDGAGAQAGSQPSNQTQQLWQNSY
ncbi:hypothetical protein HID58_075266 [Brassica napus]|uniref:GBF-interacting protein 1 N-terminal domain-containing protein n=1 Tax=Brassica napus TaxID=3708 RepID=A0ABQ7YKD4_BRANA|nr:hypothetical protein HID58_075266 [Brassica napus]